MWNTKLETRAIKKEIEIRGRYLMIGCDIEFAMLNIIIFCNPDPSNHERKGQFLRMKMSGKINSLKADLKKYKSRYFIDYEKDLDGLEEFKIVRNDMSHHIGSFPHDPDLSVFRIDIVDSEKNEHNEDIEHIKFRNYTDEYIEQSINRFAHLNRRLGELWRLLKNGLDPKTPHPINSLVIPTFTVGQLIGQLLK